MNVNAIKGLTWVAAIGVAGYLGFFIYEFLEERPELRKALSTERQKEVLEDVQPPKEDDRDLVAVARVKEVFGKDLDWTGKPPPPPPKPKAKTDEKVEVPKIPVSDLLQVTYTMAHYQDPEDKSSRAGVKYTGVLARANDRVENRTLRVGDKLPAPQDRIEVKGITTEGVIFSFLDEDREDEILATMDFDAAGVPGIVKVAEGHEARQVTRAAPLIGRRAPGNAWRPDETRLIGRNEYQLGTKTVDRFNENYGQILQRDLKYREHRDPRTGQRDGIQVTHVASGSLPAEHGLNQGDVVKSINGHKVSSVNGAINYVKSNADTTEKWTVIIERQGREITRVYNSPPN